jgi:uncharacterized protein (TIGR03437 family)
MIKSDAILRKSRSGSFTAALVLFGFVLILGPSSEDTSASGQAVKPFPNQPIGGLPVSFEVNRGQSHGSARFLARGNGYKFLLAPNESELQLRSSVKGTSATTSFRTTFVGSNPRAKAEGVDKLAGKVNYLIGKSPQKWLRNFPTYGRIRFHQIYPGIDVEYYGKGELLEYDLIVAPSSSPQTIRVSFPEVDALQLAENGDLIIRKGEDILRQLKPVGFQETDTGKARVSCWFELKEKLDVTIACADYDQSKSLVIDPQIIFTTTGIGGRAVAVDGYGNIYVADQGLMEVSPGPPQGIESGDGVYVAKLDPSGTSLIYSTYLGGDGKEWLGDLAVDDRGSAYLIGSTSSSTFPVTDAAFQTKSSAGTCGASLCTDGFFTRISPSGDSLEYSTFLGGSDIDTASRITLDGESAAYIVGSTFSQNFPVTPGAWKTNPITNLGGFLIKFSVNSNFPVFSTFITSSQGVSPVDVAVDPISLEPYVAVHNSYTGGTDVVLKLNRNGTNLLWSHEFEYSVYEAVGIKGIGTDLEGNLYVRAIVLDYFGDGVGRLLKLSRDGKRWIYATQIGAAPDKSFPSFYSGLAVDAFGYAYLVGANPGFLKPTADAFQKQISCDFEGCGAFIAKVDPTGKVIYASFLGNGSAFPFADAIDPTGALVTTGFTNGSDIRSSSGAYDASKISGRFLLKLGAAVTTVSAAHFKIAPVAPGSIVAAFGANFTATAQAASSVPLPTSLGGVTIEIKDSAGTTHPVGLFYASAGQVNYQIPLNAALGPALITLKTSTGAALNGLITIARTSPALFTLSQDGNGSAAALDAFTFAGGPFTAKRANGEANVIAFYGTGLGADATDRDIDSNVATSTAAKIDGTPAEVLYAGSVPGLVGLNQFNIVLPSGISSGSHTVILARDGVQGNPVTIQIQ